MRLKNMLLGEIQFMYKYGIIMLYCIFTVLYICFIAALPNSAKSIAAIILVFTDPAAMGLFFMGAIVLYEKSQRVESSLGVSPIKISEYITAKVISLMFVGTFAGIVICSYAGLDKVFWVAVGVAFSSILFSLCGLIVSSNTKSLNGFLISVVPFEIILCVPAILYVFGLLKSRLWLVHPGVAAIYLIEGETKLWYISVFSILAWIVLTYCICKKEVLKSFRRMGGAKL